MKKGEGLNRLRETESEDDDVIGGDLFDGMAAAAVLVA